MTRKDFELIAEIIHGIPAASVTIQVANAFAKGLKKTNPRFNEDRFLAACLKGMYDEPKGDDDV